MTRRSHIWKCAALLAGLLAGSARAHAQAETNTAAEAGLFFEKYKTASAFVRKNQREEATVTMELLILKLTGSPWLEIALLKAGELQEHNHAAVSLDHYAALGKRLAHEPYFQGDTEHAQLFRAALQGAADRGILRVRLERVRRALGQYFVRFQRMPENLADLCIDGMLDQADRLDARGRPIRYTPTHSQLRPGPVFTQFELPSVPGEEFVVKSPRIDGTSQINDSPLQYAALIKVDPRKDFRRVTADMKLENYYIAAIVAGGAIVCAPDRVLVLPTPH